MPAPKGRPKPIGSGKKKGSKIKKTLEWEEFGRKIIEGNLQNIQTHIESLPPEGQFEAMLKILAYFKPQLSRTESNGNSTVEILFKRQTDDRNLLDI